MDRSRRATTRRQHRPGSASPRSTSEASFGRQSPVSPVMAHATQSQSPRAASVGRRASKTGSHPDMTFSTPDSSRDPHSRKRIRASTYPDPASTPAHEDDDADGPRKGGHSLRKRVRVNYATEQIEDEVTVPNSSILARNKKRRSDAPDEADDFNNTPTSSRRGAPFGPDTPSARRRNPSRKSAEMKAYREDLEDEEENQNEGIHDTIRVFDPSPSAASPIEDPDHGDNRPSTPETLTANKAPQNSDTPRTPTNGPSIKADEGDETPKLPAHNAIDDSANDTLQDQTNGPDEQLREESMEAQQGMIKSAQLPTSAPTSSPHQKPDAKSSPAVPVIEKSESLIQSPEPMELGSDPVKEEPVMPEQSKQDDQVTKAPHAQETQPAGESKEIASVEKGTPPPEGQVKASETISSEPPSAPTAQGEERLEPSTEAKPTENNAPTHQVPVPAPINVPGVALESATEEVKTLLDSSFAKVQPVEEGDRMTTELVTSIKDSTPARSAYSKPQPRPIGRWSHLTPYVDGEFSSYPEKKVLSDDEDGSEDQSQEDKDPSKEMNDTEPVPDENEEGAEGGVNEIPSNGLNTPVRGSPVPELEVTALNSPAPAGEDAEDPEAAEVPDIMETRRHFKYRKLRDPEEFISIIENYEDMNTAELYEMLEAVNVSLLSWQEEWSGLGKIVDDYENATRRRIADSKYETRTRNTPQHGANYEEPDFAVKGYKAKERELMSETRYLQGQDRIMAATYGFEYDPHPSKIGRQNPETQQAGITTRGRSLRNQPRQTAKASDADGGVTGKRQRKPVQLFDPTPQDTSRASTPVPARGRRRKTANPDSDDVQQSFASSFNADDLSDADAGPAQTRRRRGPRPRVSAPDTVDDFEPASHQKPSSNLPEDAAKAGGRRGRPKVTVRDTEPEPQPRSDSGPQKSRMLTLKIPKGTNFSEPSSAITDNGDSRPSTASSDSTSHTAESSYSFRPKRQKRFREIEDGEEASLPPKKRGRRSGPVDVTEHEETIPLESVTPAVAVNSAQRKGPKIKVTRAPQGSRNGTPLSQVNADDGSEQPKEYRAMTKSEKMSASMKNRWANGNMAGAVEKRKATLAAKKAAQAAADLKLGPIAPKPKAKATKKETTLPGENPAFSQTHDYPGMGVPFSTTQ